MRDAACQLPCSAHSQLAFSTLNLAIVVLSALMMWRGLMALTRSDSPVVVVLSGSMETSMYKGDILFLDNNPETIQLVSS